MLHTGFLADPVVSVALYAETRGYYSFKSYDGTPRAKLACYWCLNEARKQMNLELAKLDALRLFAEMGIAGIDAPSARDKSVEAFERARKCLKPWISSKKAFAAKDPLDYIAMWYIMNAPEVLKRMGVDFGEVQS